MTPPTPGAAAGPRPRNMITFASMFKLKVKTPQAAHDRAADFLRAFTGFTAWDRAELLVHLPRRTPAQDALLHWLTRAPDIATRVAREAMTFDRAALLERGVEPDALCDLALERFGPALVTSTAQHGDGHECTLTWRVRPGLPPAPWLAFAAEHVGVEVGYHEQVEVVATVGELELLDPATRQPLPYQAATHYAPWRVGDSYTTGCSAMAHLWLPRRDLSLTLSLPFHEPDRAFHDYVAALDRALGQPLSRKHWRALLANQAGTGRYERKLTF